MRGEPGSTGRPIRDCMEAGGGGEGSRGLQGDRSETVWRRVGVGKGAGVCRETDQRLYGGGWGRGREGRPIRDFEEAVEVYLGEGRGVFGVGEETRPARWHR